MYRRGVVPVPMSDQLSAREAGFLLADSGAAAIALDPALPVEPLPEGVRVFAPGDIAGSAPKPPRGVRRTPAPTTRPS